MAEIDYGYGHYSEWKRTTSILRWTRGCTAMPPCCYCRRPASETQARVFILTTKKIEEIPYCGCPPIQFRCEPGKGCNAAPWSKNGAYLREMMWDGPPPFIRKRDGMYLSVAE